MKSGENEKKKFLAEKSQENEKSRKWIFFNKMQQKSGKVRVNNKIIIFYQIL